MFTGGDSSGDKQVPSQYNHNDFVANNPFVRVVEELPFPIVCDKIGDNRSMDPGALRAAMGEIIDASLDAAVSYKEPGKIMVHGALTLDLYKITKPDSIPRVSLTPSQVLEMNVDGESRTPRLAGGDDDHLESVLVNAEHVNDIDNSNETQTKHGFQVLVRDRRVETLDNLVTVLIVECTWDTATKNEIYQAGAYISNKEGIANMRRGRFAPIFLQAWGNNNWIYGVYFLFGIVKVENNRVVKVWSHSRGDENFDKMLKDGTGFLRKHSKDSYATYPDGEYVHGMLYVPRKEFTLPDVRVPGSGSSDHTKLFFQSLIRIVAGDGALAWTEKDVRDIIDARKKAVDDLKAAFFEE